MSSNNQLVVLRNRNIKNKQFEVHEHWCVDNDFEPSKETLLKRFETLVEAIKFANKYCDENLVEYGYRISDGALK